MRYGSICSGIGGAEVALGMKLGWECAFMSEIASFPRAVLQHHFPDTKLYGDFREIEADGTTLDLLGGGPPCQDFSVAGKRAGMAGERGSLTLAYVELVARLRPRWLLYENVPGLLSSNQGRDFGAFLGALENIGYCFAWRVLDAQYFGVPQRRRRLYVVGYFGSAWQRPASVLFDAQSLSRHSTKIRPTKTPSDVALCVTARFGSGRNDPTAETYIVDPGAEVSHTLRAEGFDASEDGSGRGTPLVAVVFDTTQITSAANRSNPKPGDPCHTLARGAHAPAIAFSFKDYGADAGIVSPTLRALNHRDSHANAGSQVAIAFTCEVTPKSNVGQALTLTQPSPSGGGHPQSVAYQCQGGSVGPMGTLRAGNGDVTGGVPFLEADWRVRRFVPIETERLQGFPDDWTLVPVRTTKAGKVIMAADGPRYKGCGNAFATVVVEWIGRRIQIVDEATREAQGAA